MRSSPKRQASRNLKGTCLHGHCIFLYTTRGMAFLIPRFCHLLVSLDLHPVEPGMHKWPPQTHSGRKEQLAYSEVARSVQVAYLECPGTRFR